jgi:hypothetical protein
MPKKLRSLRRAKRIPKGRRIDVSRAEFDKVIDILNERADIMNGLRKDLDIQFQRIAQIQVELDVLRQMLEASSARKLR